MIEFFVEFTHNFFSTFGLTVFFLFIAHSVNPNIGYLAVVLCACLAGVIEIFAAVKLEDRRKEREVYDGRTNKPD